jgi:hypothetical protein
MAVTVGQLAAPVIFTTLLQFAILVPVAALQFGITLPVVAAIAILPSANLFIFGLENLVFLLYPFRAANVGAGDFQAFSRHMLVQMIKMLALGVAVGVSAGIGGLAWFVSGQSRIAFAAGIWLSVTGLALALLPLVTFAFQRLDPPLDLS